MRASTPNSLMMKRIRKNTRSYGRLGAYSVEFALCGGLFFFILLSGIEFTRFMYARHSVDQAAYEAARIGIIPGKSPDDVRERAQQILGATGIRNAVVTVSPSVFNDQTGTVTVSIQAPFAASSWLRPLFLATSDLVSSITLDHENQAYLTNATGDNIGDNDNEPIDI